MFLLLAPQGSIDFCGTSTAYALTPQTQPKAALLHIFNYPSFYFLLILCFYFAVHVNCLKSSEKEGEYKQTWPDDIIYRDVLSPSK